MHRELPVAGSGEPMDDAQLWLVEVKSRRLQEGLVNLLAFQSCGSILPQGYHASYGTAFTWLIFNEGAEQGGSKYNTRLQLLFFTSLRSVQQEGLGTETRNCHAGKAVRGTD